MKAKAIGLVAVAAAFVIGCAHTPKGPGERADLTNAAQQELARMVSEHPDIQPLLDQSVGYIVFPAVGQGGFIVGGGAGQGVLFENGRASGFAELHNLAVGALAGGQRFAQLVIIQDQQTMQNIKSGRYDFGAQASAVILRSGATANANFRNGVAVIIDPIRGAMVNASLTGQRIKVTM